MRNAFVCVLVVTALLATAVPGFAQTFGQITGVVTDASGGVVVGATVTITNPQTSFTRSTTTNSGGNYTFPSLLPSVYDIKAEMQGFQSEIHSGVELQVEQVARIDFRLKVGSVSESVEVSGGAPLLNTESATVGTVIDNQRIVDLPLNGRDFLQLIALSPNVTANFASGGNSGGVAATRVGGDRSNQNFSVAGMRREFSYYTLDGISDTDVNFNTYLFLPSIDALQEFKVETGVFPAEFGREAAQVNVSTKSGTNEYHGAAFEFLRNNVLDARPYGFTTSVPVTAPFRWNQFGFTLGGPIQIPKLFNGKNRLFFLSNYEGFRWLNQTQAIYSVPSVAMRGGNFSEILPGTVIKDPANNNLPFQNNMIPSGRIDEISKSLLSYYPAPNIPGAGLANNYLALDNNITHKDQFTQRIDLVESTKSSWFGRYSWQPENVITPALDLNGTNEILSAKQAMLSNTRILSPNWVNEFRFGYSGFNNTFGRQLAYQQDVVKAVGLTPQLSDPTPANWGIPASTITGFSGFGDNTDGSYVTNDHIFQWIDNISWIHGAHSVKFGAEIRRDRFNEAGVQFSRGSFMFANGATGYGFSDYLLGYIQQTTDSVVPEGVAEFRATSQAYYGDDSWKIRPNLTIDFGLRYEFVPPFSDRNPTLTNLYIPVPQAPPNAPLSEHPCLIRNGTGDFYANTIIRFPSNVCVARDGRLGPNLIASDYKNFAPRLGIAWSPARNWTVRLGAGFFYVQDMGNTAFDMALNLTGTQIANATAGAHNLTLENPLGAATANACGVSAPLVCVSAPKILINDYNRRTPYIELYELNIQRQLSNNTVLELGYLGSQGHRLQRLQWDGQVTPGATGSTTSRAPFPEFSKIQMLIGEANSNYNAFSAKITRRLSNGLTYLAGYTFSKSIDDGSGERIVGSDQQAPQNSLCVSCERALSLFDARDRFVASVLYDLPFGTGRKFLTRGIASRIIGGWQLSSILSASTGFPLNIGAGKDQSNTGLGYDRPNATGSSITLSNPTTAEWFNIQAVALQTFGTFGNLGRNVVTGPGIFDVDFATLKNFNFTEKRYLQFRVEAFNALNHPNFGDPNTNLSADALTASGSPIAGSGAFGTITSTRTGIDMRNLQFSLKLMF